MTASALGTPIARLLVGPLAEWGGLGATFAAVAGVMTVGAGLFAFTALRADAAASSAAAGAAAA